ncbi:hypothetical protein RRG08_062066 [Elysia crispata]|uniref:G-protein coupled receptors family 1 profile domain-containing protein n=1 Tax=Elysia crispata TaxID=231223 RepID=A0AAE0YPK1_9GAST|nr:hypothetical protein RRG08_062066 [Elysia crispata]
MAQYDKVNSQSDSFNSSCWNCSTNLTTSSVSSTTPPTVTDDSDIWPWRVGLFGGGGTIIACVGVVSNIVAIVVLAHYRTKSTAPFLLICLAVFDTLFLTSELFLETLTYLAQGGVISDSYRDFIRPIYCILFPVPLLFRTNSAYTILLITLERYTVVAWPLTAHRLLRPRVARLAVVVVISFVLVYHTPVYLAFSCSTIFHNKTQRNVLKFHRTSFGKSEFYNHVYHTWMNLTVHFWIPFLLLLVFNVLLLVALKRSKTHGPATNDTQNRTKRERRLTVMVLCMTGIFFLCELFPAVSFILTTGLNRFNECSMNCNRFSAVADTIIMLNAAINFAIYCATGRKFRDVFRQVFCSRICLAHTSGGTTTRNSRSSSDRVENSSRKISAQPGHHDSVHQGWSTRLRSFFCCSRGGAPRGSGPSRTSSTVLSSVTFPAETNRFAPLRAVRKSLRDEGPR